MLCMLLNIRSPLGAIAIMNIEILPLPCSTTLRTYFSVMGDKCGCDNDFFEFLVMLC